MVEMTYSSDFTSYEAVFIDMIFFYNRTPADTRRSNVNIDKSWYFC